MEYTLEKVQEVGMMMVADVGTAKSMYMEALSEAKNGNFDRADELIVDGDNHLQEGHKRHADLVYHEAGGKPITFSLILMHAEDQLLTTETLKIMILELIEIYKRK